MLGGQWWSLTGDGTASPGGIWEQVGLGGLSQQGGHCCSSADGSQGGQMSGDAPGSAQLGRIVSATVPIAPAIEKHTVLLFSN